MTQNIKQCTGSEPHLELGENTCTVSLDVIDPVIHYVCKMNIRGVKRPYNQIFTEGWEETFSISHTISRDRLKYIIRFLCFYVERKIVEIRDGYVHTYIGIVESFLENSSSCY